jgi:hypothetical protein
MNIGDWVQRHTVNEHGKLMPEATGKIHHVDSRVENRAVTRCGIELERNTPEGRLVRAIEPLPDEDVCDNCRKGVTAEPATTATVDEEAAADTQPPEGQHFTESSTAATAPDPAQDEGATP